jgi:hypothetical protein
MGGGQTGEKSASRKYRAANLEIVRKKDRESGQGGRRPRNHEWLIARASGKRCVVMALVFRRPGQTPLLEHQTSSCQSLLAVVARPAGEAYCFAR